MYGEIVPGDPTLLMEIAQSLGQQDCANALIRYVEYSCRHLLYGAWDYQEWRRKHLADYVKMCASFQEDLELTNTSQNRPYNNHPEPVESTTHD